MCRGFGSVNLTKILRAQAERVKLFCMHTSPFIKKIIEPAPTSTCAEQLLIQPRCRFVEIREVVEEEVGVEEGQVLEVVVVSNQNCPAQNCMMLKLPRL